MKLERVNTNHYNKYQNKLLHIRNYTISIQCNENVQCSPKINLKDPQKYDKYEVIVFFKGDPVIPMGYKQFFNSQGVAGNLDKVTIIKILNYINSPICMTMGVECL